ncbi:hypothetical protein CLOBOL_07113 [Enterocloster bolteae ATCC BAA-613]|uniref:Uncharacterized protein n=1 Tax=Enterocloster bolteae (strain ATCC BAA-613 / DSM 15670 / CCUG 46953 / JCM 12243 / WAL 16351) TaxID=411902 RepID=A8S560_ENTBW|nr:hypothetical protein CLOBOL_07113 [Enterocloster bolteae ATCC BAA-613]
MLSCRLPAVIKRQGPVFFFLLRANGFPLSTYNKSRN